MHGYTSTKRLAYAELGLEVADWPGFQFAVYQSAPVDPTTYVLDKKASDTEMESTTSIPTTTNENKQVMTLPPPVFAMLTAEPESVEDVSPHVVATKKTRSPVKKAGHVYINEKSLSA